MKTTRIREKIKLFLSDGPQSTSKILEHINSNMRHGTTSQQLGNVLSKDEDLLKYTNDNFNPKWGTWDWVASNPSPKVEPKSHGREKPEDDKILSCINLFKHSLESKYDRLNHRIALKNGGGENFSIVDSIDADYTDALFPYICKNNSIWTYQHVVQSHEKQLDYKQKIFVASRLIQYMVSQNMYTIHSNCGILMYRARHIAITTINHIISRQTSIDKKGEIETFRKALLSLYNDLGMISLIVSDLNGASNAFFSAGVLARDSNNEEINENSSLYLSKYFFEKVSVLDKKISPLIENLSHRKNLALSAFIQGRYNYSAKLFLTIWNDLDYQKPDRFLAAKMLEVCSRLEKNDLMGFWNDDIKMEQYKQNFSEDLGTEFRDSIDNLNHFLKLKETESSKESNHLVTLFHIKLSHGGHYIGQTTNFEKRILSFPNSVLVSKRENLSIEQFRYIRNNIVNLLEINSLNYEISRAAAAC